MPEAPLDILDFDHVGIRVSDRDRAMAFYSQLGFQITEEYPEDHVVILRHPSGVELNLIVNAHAAGPNVLMDLPEKRAGLTHVALRVPSADGAAYALQAAGIALSEGPVNLGASQRSVFVRDPDRNVIEFTQLLEPAP